jgi:hypothetical protein
MDALEAFGTDWSAPLVIAGADAADLAEQCARRASFGIAAEGEDWFLLAPEAPDTAPEGWPGLPPGIAGTVILRRAWPDRPGLDAAVGAAARLLRRGGRLIAADIDVDRLLGGSPVAYPYQLRFTLDPEAAAALRSSTVSTADLAVEVGRAGMRRVVGLTVDEERGRFAEAAAYWVGVRDGAWPSLAGTAPEARGMLLEDLAAQLSRIAPMGGIVERRPWFVATGVGV